MLFVFEAVVVTTRRRNLQQVRSYNGPAVVNVTRAVVCVSCVACVCRITITISGLWRFSD